MKEEHTSAKLPVDKKKKVLQLQVTTESTMIALSSEGTTEQDTVMDIAVQHKCDVCNYDSYEEN